MAMTNTDSATDNQREPSQAPDAAHCQVFGLNIAALTRSEAAALLERRLRERRPVKLAFVNANLANRAYEDPELRGVLGSFLLLNDGSGLNLASRLLDGRSFPDNLNGTDFTPYFLDQCRTPLKVFLLGATPPVVERTVEVFARRWPQHQVAGYQHGFLTEAEENNIIETIKGLQPDLVLVAMGNGIQERWAARLVPDAALSAWGVGALFDFLAGAVPRAPAWMRQLGIEWVYRLMLEPRRLWQRYVVGNPKFVLRVLRQRRRRVQP